MQTYRPKKPTGRGAIWTWRRWIWDMLAGGLFPIRGDGSIVVDWKDGYYRISSKTQTVGSNQKGWYFGNKIELPTAPYPSFNAQQVIHIQPTHDIVVTGIHDAANPTGAIVKSCAGLWVATQNVPPQTTASGHPVWNLPQYPYPNPLNLDDPLNFWYYLGEMTC
jgi:hypothetical protein